MHCALKHFTTVSSLDLGGTLVIQGLLAPWPDDLSRALRENSFGGLLGAGKLTEWMTAVCSCRIQLAMCWLLSA